MIPPMPRTRGPENLAWQSQYGNQTQQPGKAQSQQGPYANSTPYGQQQAPQGGFQAWNPNMANNPQAPRPPAFQATYGQIGGGYSSQPNFGQRDAFIQNLNQQMGQHIQMGMGGPPQFNIGQAWNQAGNMAQQGWQNPFAQQPAFQQFQAPGGNIRDLIQGPQPGKPDPTPRLPAGLYRPENMRTDRGPDWHTTYYNPSTGETFQSYKNTVRPEEGSGWVNQGRESPFGSRLDPAGRPLPGAHTQDFIDSDRDGLDDRFGIRRWADTPDGRMSRMTYPGGTPEVPGKSNDRGKADPRRPASEDVRIVDDSGFTFPGQAQPVQDPYGSSTPLGADPYADYQREITNRQSAQNRQQGMSDLYALMNMGPLPTNVLGFDFDRWMAQQRRSSDREFQNAQQYHPERLNDLSGQLFTFLERGGQTGSPGQTLLTPTGNPTVDARHRSLYAAQAGDALRASVAAGVLSQQEAGAVRRWIDTGGKEGESPADAKKRFDYKQWLQGRGASAEEAGRLAAQQYAIPAGAGPVDFGGGGSYVAAHKQIYGAENRKLAALTAAANKELYPLGTSEAATQRQGRLRDQGLSLGQVREVARLESQMRSAKDQLNWRQGDPGRPVSATEKSRLRTELAQYESQLRKLGAAPGQPGGATGFKGEVVTVPGGQQWARSGNPLADLGRQRNARVGTGFTGID